MHATVSILRMKVLKTFRSERAILSPPGVFAPMVRPEMMN